MWKMLDKSVRLRLTLWYVALLAAVLVLFSFGVYSMVAAGSRERLDSGLRSAVQVTALALNHEIEEHGGREAGEENVRMVLNTMHITSFPRPGISVWDGSRLVAEKPGEAGLPARSIPNRLESQSQVSFSVFHAGTHAYRVASAEVPVPFIDAQYQVVANETLAPLEEELSELREILLLAVPLSLLLAAAGGYFLARKSLAPVVGMARTAERISSHNLEQRLVVQNPADELGQLAETFNRLLERLQATFEQQRQFMADASHELRTPLSIALTAVQVDLKSPSRSAEELVSDMRVVEEQLKRLRRIVEDMFTLAQADAGAFRAKKELFYLDELLDDAVRAARVLAGAKAITVAASSTARDLTFEGDEDLIRQLLLILLDNAIKYNQPGGSVEISLDVAPEEYRIRVRDTGSGISPADQQRIFDRFYRVDKARSRRESRLGGGAGLGLSIAVWIAGLHGGSVYLERSGLEGSVFVVLLPRNASDSAHAAQADPDCVVRLDGDKLPAR